MNIPKLSSPSCQKNNRSPFLNTQFDIIHTTMASAVKAGVENVLSKLSLGDSGSEVRAPSPEAVKELKQKFEEVEQGHVFAFYDDLTDAEKAGLFQQLSNMNPKRISVSDFLCFVFSGISGRMSAVLP